MCWWVSSMCMGNMWRSFRWRAWIWRRYSRLFEERNDWRNGNVIWCSGSFYTTDYFVPSAFNPEIQVISVYYLMRPSGEMTLKISILLSILKRRRRRSILSIYWPWIAGYRWFYFFNWPSRCSEVEESVFKRGILKIRAEINRHSLICSWVRRIQLCLGYRKPRPDRTIFRCSCNSYLGCGQVIIKRYMTGHIKCMFQKSVCHTKTVISFSPVFSKTIPDFISTKVESFHGRWSKDSAPESKPETPKRNHSKFHRCWTGKVNDSASYKWTPVVDPNDSFLPVCFVVNVYNCIERKRSMCRRKIILIIKFTVTCFLSLKTIMIEGSFSGMRNWIFALSICRKDGNAREGKTTQIPEELHEELFYQSICKNVKNNRIIFLLLKIVDSF